MPELEGTRAGAPAPPWAHVGLIAGNGAFPRLFARAARAAGARVTAVALRGETLPGLEVEVDALHWVHVGQVGRMVRHLRRGGVQVAAMAGGVDKRRLFTKARLDWTGARLLWRLARRQDDGMLRAIAHVFERGGVPIVSSTCYLPRAMVPPGPLGQHRPTAKAWRDLAYGLEVARSIGALDVGQTAVVRAGAVVALEAIEGTDACLRRGGALCAGRDAVAVKVAKPAQDMRFDVPAVGPRTVEVAFEAGIHVLGLEAGRTLLLEPDVVRARADALGICVVGLPWEAP